MRAGNETCREKGEFVRWGIREPREGERTWPTLPRVITSTDVLCDAHESPARLRYDTTYASMLPARPGPKLEFKPNPFTLLSGAVRGIQNGQ